MEREELYSVIQEIAVKLNDKGEVFTRADLAYNLCGYGVKSDSLEVSKAVYEAFLHYGSDNRIRFAYVNNEGKRSLVDEYMVVHMVDSESYGEVYSLFDDKRQLGAQSIKMLDNAMKISFDKVGQSKYGLKKKLVGTVAIEKIKDEATSILDKYSYLISSYDDAKESIKSAAVDFIFFRERILEIYKKYLFALVDIFGDSIKSVAPQVFDFDRIEWLDVKQMMQSVELEYNNIINTSTLLMSEVKESFGKALTDSANDYGKTKDASVGLVLVALNMFNHYADSAGKAALLEEDLLSLKTSVGKDVATIRGDMERLVAVYKTINDLYIPRSRAFHKYSEQVLSKELEQLLASIYNTDELAELRSKRDGKLVEHKQTSNIITDILLNIESYTSQIAVRENALNYAEPRYNNAKDTRPKAPSLFIKIFTFGISGRRYNRDMYEWYHDNVNIINEYESLQKELLLDRSELKDFERKLNKETGMLQLIDTELEMYNEDILKIIKVDDETKSQMLTHLEPLVNLLRIAKNIVSSSLDDRLTNTVSLGSITDVSIPTDISQSVSNFANSLRDSFVVTPSHTKTTLDIVGDEICFIDSYSDGIDEDDLSILNGAQNVAVQKAIDYFEALANLRLMREKGEMQLEAYNKKVGEIKSSFERVFTDIDNESEVLRESLRQINTASGHNELRDALLTLSEDGNEVLSLEDLNHFLQGHKQIEI